MPGLNRLRLPGELDTGHSIRHHDVAEQKINRLAGLEHLDRVVATSGA